jgi:hypothetical protein
MGDIIAGQFVFPDQSTQSEILYVTCKPDRGRTLYAIIETSGYGEWALYLPPGSYALRFRGRKWLDVSIKAITGTLFDPITMIAGNVNWDNRIDDDDLTRLGMVFNRIVPPTPPDWQPGEYTSDEEVCDLNADGVVDIEDLAILAANWGRIGQ